MAVAQGPRERVANPVFVAAFSTQALATLAQYGLLLLTPLLLDDRGWGSAAVGGALSLLTVGLIVTSPPGGRLGDVRGRRFPVLVGLGVAAVAVAMSAAFGDATTSAVLMVTLLLFGLGLGLATPGIQTAGIEAAPERRIGFASGLLSASRYVGSITASILLTVLVNDAGGGSGTMLVLCTVALVLALGTACALPGPRLARVLAVSDATGPTD
jgi:MFS family permease